MLSKISGFSSLYSEGWAFSCQNNSEAQKLNPTITTSVHFIPIPAIRKPPKACPKTEELKNIAWLIGDIEQLTLPQSLDAVISSSALQWMTDLPTLLHRIHDALKPNAYFGFSTFGPDNLTEIKQLTGQGLNYIDLQSTDISSTS